MTVKKYSLREAAKLLGKPDRGRIYSVKDAARRLGISDSHCRRLLETGKIEGKKPGHDWVVLKLNYKRKRKPKGGQSNENG